MTFSTVLWCGMNSGSKTEIIAFGNKIPWLNKLAFFSGGHDWPI